MPKQQISHGGYGFSADALRREVVSLLSAVGAAQVVQRSRIEWLPDTSSGRAIGGLSDEIVETPVKRALLSCAIVHRVMYQAGKRRKICDWFDQNPCGYINFSQRTFNLALVDCFDKIVHSDVVSIHYDDKFAVTYLSGTPGDASLGYRVRIEGRGNRGKKQKWRCDFLVIHLCEVILHFVENMSVSLSSETQIFKEIASFKVKSEEEDVSNILTRFLGEIPDGRFIEDGS